MISFLRLQTLVLLALSLALARTEAASRDNVPLIRAEHAQAIYANLLQTHWVPRTGLFLSFPDSLDRKLSQQASVYEQAAVGLLALRVGDTARAQGLAKFLGEKWAAEPLRPERNGMFGLANFYNAEFGTGGIEQTVHSGPNAWVGLFAARLANTTNDPEPRKLALDIAYWLANGVPHAGGAVAMGPRDDPHGAPWSRVFSTENNLSYYAMLTELLRSPALEKEQRVSLTQERDRIENWLVNKAFNRTTYKLVRGFNPQGPDKIQALDTVTWFVSALGPQKLAARGIDPHRLMQTAAKAFEVKLADAEGVDATDQEEADWMYAFDRAGGPPARPLAYKHRMIWYEGLGQYVLALAAMADYSRQAGAAPLEKQYAARAQALTKAYDHAALKNYSGQAAYPYATAGKFYRDGWQTQAQSKEGPAASLVAATWRCFAGLGSDPMAGHDLTTVARVNVRTPKVAQMDRPRPAILYGTSEDMVVNAWRALQKDKVDDAIEQAKATVQEWSPWAQRLQDRKMRELGQLVNYTGEASEKTLVFKYWALNDVGAAYFILGKAYDQKGDYTNAARAFQQIVNHYSLAQVWDPAGWFWAPAEAVTNDFVLRDPEHYGQVVPKVFAEGSSTGKKPENN
jgi:hypothetical protein